MPLGKVGCYANDFLDSWSRCDLIVGSSSSMPIKMGVVETICVATHVGKGKEKKIKQEAIQKSDVEGCAEGTKAGHGTKMRKIVLACKQLVVSKGPEEADPYAIGKEVIHPLIPKIRVKTKVKSSILQILVGLKEPLLQLSLPQPKFLQGPLILFPDLPRDPLDVPIVGKRLLKNMQREREREREKERRTMPHSFFFHSFFLTYPH